MAYTLIELPSSTLGNLEYGQFAKAQLTQIALIPAGTIKDGTLITAIKSVTDDSSEFDKALVKVAKN